MTKTVLITGASSGFGKDAVRLFQKNGWNVIASMRSPEKETELGGLDNVLLVRLDVTDSESIHIFEAATDGSEQLRYPVGADAVHFAQARKEMDAQCRASSRHFVSDFTPFPVSGSTTS